MVLVFAGKTKCALCGELLLDGEEIVGFPAFLPSTHSLWRFSDAAFHENCYESWNYRERFDMLYRRFRDVWNSRPLELTDPAEQEAWGREAFRGLFEEDEAENI